MLTWEDMPSSISNLLLDLCRLPSISRLQFDLVSIPSKIATKAQCPHLQLIKLHDDAISTGGNLDLSPDPLPNGKYHTRYSAFGDLCITRYQARSRREISFSKARYLIVGGVYIAVSS